MPPLELSHRPRRATKALVRVSVVLGGYHERDAVFRALARELRAVPRFRTSRWSLGSCSTTLRVRLRKHQLTQGGGVRTDAHFGRSMAKDAPQRLRLAELIAALSLAVDLGLGQPMAHVLRTCLFALSLGRLLGLPEHDLADAYYTTLLRFVGCTADAHEMMDFAAGQDVAFRQLMMVIGNDTREEVAPQLERFLTDVGVRNDVAGRVRNALESPEGAGARIAAAHCEVATMLAARLGLGSKVCDALRHGFERWDGLGFPDGEAGDRVPAPVRLAVVAKDIEVLVRTRGLEQTCDALKRRRGRALDPRVVDLFLRHGAAVVAEIDGCDAWTEVLRREPGGPIWVPPERIDQALSAFADFADLKTPFTLGHSRGVAQLAEAAAHGLGLSSVDAVHARRAGLLHDIGRCGVPNAIWERKGALSMGEWEHVRLHVYYTERVLNRCDCLDAIRSIAAAHHERLDGSGYHRGIRAAGLDPTMRLLAAADACQAMQQTRAHRPARTLDEAARLLRGEVESGRLDARAVGAVLAAAGAKPERIARPVGLTDREVEVLGLVARGRSNRDIASVLGITPKTAGHHVQHIYDKIGVSTRAAAAVFAVENGLVHL